MSSIPCYESTDSLGLEEFKTSLRTYTKTLNQAKSQQSLKNYHSKYRQFMQSRIEKSREKASIKANSLILPSTSTLFSYNIFLALYSFKGLKVSLRLPLTLYVSKSCNFLIKEGVFLNIVTGPKIADEFLAGLHNQPGFPVCIYKPDDEKTELLENLEEVKWCIDKNQKKNAVFQRFVFASGNKASVLAVHMKRGKKPIMQVFQNNAELNRINYTRLESNEINRYSCGIISGSISTQPTLSLSLSPNLIKDQSMIELEETFVMPKPRFGKQLGLLQRIRSVENNDFPESNEQFFTVNLKNSRGITPYMIKSKNPEVEKMTENVFNLVNQEFRQKLKNSAEEIYAIFVKDRNNSWFFIKVHAIKLEKPLDWTASNDIKQVSDNSSSSDLEVYHKSPSNVKNAVRKAINKLKTLNNLVVVKSLPKIKAKSFLHKRDKPAYKINDNCYQSLIDNAALQYDIAKMITPEYLRNKFNIKKKLQTTQLWNIFSLNFNNDLVNSSIGGYFENLEQDKLKSHIKGQFKIFLCDVDCKFKESIKMYHCSLKITNEAYEEFRKIFYKNATVVLNNEGEIETVMKNFDMMKEAIVFKW